MRLRKWVSPILVAALGCLIVCPPAVSAKAPTGDFAGFSECPRFTPKVELCILSRSTGEEVKIGGTLVPIGKTIALQGGIQLTREPFTETFVGALSGETLSKTPLTVPGGLTGLIASGSLLGMFGLKTVTGGAMAVTATTELAGAPTIDMSGLESREGTVFSLPVRIKLENSFLGSECYIGSRVNPIVIDLTAGKTSPPPPNRPIEGRDGGSNLKDELEFVEFYGNVLVDNSFAVPRVTGCGGSLSSLLDPVIDAKLGLPSPPGKNTFILKGTLQEAGARSVIASEK